MDKRKAYYVSRKNVLTWVSVLLILCSAMVRIYLYCEKGTVPGGSFAFQILLPVFAEILFVLIVLLDGKNHIYRTAIPVFLFALSEMIAAADRTLWPRLFVWLLCVVFSFLYLEVISGRVRGWADCLSVGLMLLVMLLIRIFPDDLVGRHFRLAEDWLQDLPLLCALAGLLFLMLGLKRYLDGKYHKTWGDRPDGRLVRSLDPMTYVGVYIMPSRTGCGNLFQDSVDVTDVDKYLRRKKKEGMTQLTITHIFLAAYCRAVARYPAVNRFIAGQKIYQRDGDLVFNMVIKREMTTAGEETVIKLHLTPGDTLQTVSEKFSEAVNAAKNEEGSDFDKTAALLTMIPGLLMKFAIWLLKTLDYFGLLPGALLEVSPFHGSIFFTSMASLGIPSVFHHLYDFGNLPVFCCLGGKYRKLVTRDDGTAEERKFMDFTINCDDRICDGFYYAATQKAFKRYILHPELLEVPPEEIVQDVD